MHSTAATQRSFDCKLDHNQMQLGTHKLSRMACDGTAALLLCLCMVHASPLTNCSATMLQRSLVDNVQRKK